jgi:serine/threonine protein kinase
MIFDNHISKAQDSWALGCFIYNVLTNRLLFDLSYIYNKDSRDDEHLIQLFLLLGPLPAKLKHSWPRYKVYFDNEGQLKKFVENDESFSYTELENLPEDDCRSTTSDAMDNDLQQENDEALSITPPDYLSQEPFDPESYPSIHKVYERKGRKQGPIESIADYTALNPPLQDRWLNEKHPGLQLEESELVLDLLQGLLTYDPDRRLSTKGLLQHAWNRNYCASDGTR